MSMSTLGAQLAALNGAKSGSHQAGSVLPTSRRHEDAVGRGVYHSVQTGHSIVGKKSHIYKASILFQDARQASNVPMTTLRDNCVQALEELAAPTSEKSSVDTFFLDIIPKMKDERTAERGLMTKAENEEFDQMLEGLLYRLALRMTASSSSTDMINPGLNVIEYLMRAYDLHIRPKLVSTLLLVWLPHHEHAYFLRWLQLVDLASLPLYAWLRPFAIPNAIVNRSVIAKAVSKNLGLCREILKLSQRVSSLPNADGALSFTAAVLVEAMTLQHRANGSMDERTAQTMLPTIQRACQLQTGTNDHNSTSSSIHFVNWGYVLASTLMETCSLADEPRKNLVKSILAGISSSFTIQSDGDVEMRDSSVEKTNAERVQNALLLVLSILHQQPTMDAMSITSEKMSSQITIGTSMDSRNVHGYANSSCIDSSAIFNAMMAIDGFQSHLGFLLGKGGFTDVIDWVASIFVVGWKRFEKSRLKKKTNDDLAAFLSALLEEPMLLQHVWLKSDWITAVVAFLLMNSTIDNKEDHHVLQKFLTSFRDRDPTAYERGIAQALLGLKRDARMRLAGYLGIASNDKLIGEPSEADALLPPRVAIEHADVEIRLSAVDRLFEDDGEDIAKLLIKRVLQEENIHVASKAAESLCKLLDRNELKELSLDSDFLGFADFVRMSVYKWTEKSEIDSKANLLRHLVRLASVVLNRLKKKKMSETLFIQFLESLAAYVSNNDASIHEEAVNGIIFGLTGKKGTKKGKLADLHKAIAGLDGIYLEQLARKEINHSMVFSEVELAMRRRSIPILLKAFCEEKMKGKTSAVLKYCVWSIKMCGESATDDEKKHLLLSLKSTESLFETQPDELLTVILELLDGHALLLDEVISPFVIGAASFVKTKMNEKVCSISIFMELATRPTTKAQVVRHLLCISKELAAQHPASCHFGLMYALALLTHGESDIRKEAFDLIADIRGIVLSSEVQEVHSLSGLCNYVFNNKSSALMGSQSFLSTGFATALTESKEAASTITKLILVALSGNATMASLGLSVVLQDEYVSLSTLCGGHKTAIVLMEALKGAGENVSPLALRWSSLGKPILDAVFAKRIQEDCSPCLNSVFEHVVEMMKGVREIDTNSINGTSVVITSSPGTNGGRSRSYSFGKIEASKFCSPYPNEMAEMCVAILKNNDSNRVMHGIRETFCDRVIANKSWGEHVYVKLSKAIRKKMVAALLNSLIHDFGEKQERAFFSLPLSSTDTTDLLKQKTQGRGNVAMTTYVADFVRANCARLINEPEVETVFLALFESFHSLSSSQLQEEDGRDFARMSILDALKDLFEVVPDNMAKKFNLTKKRGFEDWITSLVEVLNHDTSSVYRPLTTARSRKSTITVLTSLCSLYPTAVTQKLIEAIVLMVSTAKTDKDVHMVAELLNFIVPVYLRLSTSANLTPLELIEPFVAASKEIEGKTRVFLFQGFVASIHRLEREENGAAKLFLGPFVACCLASDLFYKARDEDANDSSMLRSQLLDQIPVLKRLIAISDVVSYSKEVVLQMTGENPTPSNNIVTIHDLLQLSETGKTTKTKTKEHSIESQQRLCATLLGASCEVISSSAFSRYLAHCKSKSSETVVRLWQDLLLLQSICNSQLASSNIQNGVFWVSLLETTNETLGSIQRHLPSPIFLAFATSLVKEADSDDLKARALQLVADRALLLDGLNAEACLFLDLLPYLTDLISGEDSKLLKNAALVTIEHISRKACLESGGKTSKYLDSISKCLTKVSNLFETEGSFFSSKKRIHTVGSSLQILCTASLCAATCIRAIGARSLPVMPVLLRRSLNVFGYVNTSLSDKTTSDDRDQLRIIQLSLLRLITATVGCIPQFMGPYLHLLLQPNMLCSSSLYKDDEKGSAIKEAAITLKQSVASKIPSRQLIAPLTTSLTKSTSTTGIIVLIDVMTMMIDNSKSSELGSKLGSILRAGTHVYTFAAQCESNSNLLEVTTSMLMKLVFKLSEIQMRSLYSKFRDWRGDFAKENPVDHAFQRYCFWLFSVSLADQLKSIFLPCLTSVFSDAVDELDCAASHLGKRAKTTGNKKQRLSDNDYIQYNRNAMLSLQASLKCVEISLRSDAHEGGTWIRDGEAERFELLLSPLSKLLECKIEGDHSISYRNLVQGNNDDAGCVVDCIVALASAAGDEQKWKPLNHSVLQACSNETRPEVRKAGIHCLLSLIKSVGEEYMVLVPECLPVLSELLEDADEETAGMAQECISISEELLGESLEDSLR